jgi:predicted nucleic acid-binding protein
MIILDTCVVSETLRPEPSKKVLERLDSLPEHRMHLPVFVVGELQKGIELLPKGKKQKALKIWFEQLCERFYDRILATRNLSHYKNTGVDLIDPWS